MNKWKGRVVRVAAGAALTLVVTLAFGVCGGAAEAHMFKTLYRFSGGADGANPFGSIVQDSHGNIYGCAVQAGTAKWGTVYRLDKFGKATTLHSFANGPDGANPNGLVKDARGDVYGTTSGGGSSSAGTVFKIGRNGVETIIHNFTNYPADLATPLNGLIRGPGGILYGTTSSGGDGPCNYGGGLGCGGVFEVDRTGNERSLYTFQNAGDGEDPAGGLALDAAGNLYGTTNIGGSKACFGGCGGVYRISPSGSEMMLYDFQGGNDGFHPVAPPIVDSTGNLYGTTFNGGVQSAGTVYKLDPAGSEQVLHSFTGSDGANPQGGLIADNAGNLYGTTVNGGKYGYGAVFRLNRKGALTVLHSFRNWDGANPYSNLMLDAAGNLDGTTWAGGFGEGTVFTIRP
jgi:uncharacterized repeat protein (TIGR03803 family)